MGADHDPSGAIGTVSHYFSHLSVAAVALSGRLAVGQRIHLRGHTTDLEQVVDSMQVDHAAVTAAGPGDDVAIHVNGHVREGDLIFPEG
jgi:hypothetical protein